MAWLRRLIGAVLAMVVAGAVLLAGFAIFVSQDSVRDEVVARAEALTGFDVVVRGGVSFSLLPSLRFELDEVAFLPPGLDEAFATTDMLSGSLDPWSLLRGELRAASFNFVRPRIVLERREDGSGNWQAGEQGLLSRAIVLAKGQVSPDTELGRVRIRDGRVTLIDRRTGMKEEISALGGEVNWPRLGGWAEGLMSGVWRGEILEAGFNAGEPLELLRGERGGLYVDATGGGADLVFRGTAVLAPDVQLEGDLDFQAGSLRNVLDLLGGDVDRGPGLKSASVRGKLQLVNKAASLSDARLSLDGNTAEGTLGLDFSAPVPTVRGTFAMDTLDLNTYWRTSLRPEEAAPLLLDREIDTDELHRVALDIRFSASRVLLSEMALGRTAGTVTSRDNSFVVGIAETEIYNGRASGTVQVTSREHGTEWQTTGAFEEVDVQPLFQSLARLEQIQGRGSMRFNAVGTGASLREVMATLDGEVAVDVPGGRISGLDAQALAGALAAGRLEDLATVGGGESSFQALSAHATIEDGVAGVDRFLLEAGALAIGGEGRVWLPQGEMDGSAELRLTDVPDGTDAIAMMPLAVRGTLAEPRIFPPARWLLDRAAGAAPGADDLDGPDDSVVDGGLRGPTLAR